MFITIDQIRGYSGYATATRNLALAMSKEYPVSCMDFNQIGYLPEAIYPLLTQPIASVRENDIIFGRPYFDDPFKVKAKNYIANFVLEGTKFPERMIAQLNDDRFKQIWVPSIHIETNLLENNVILDKIKVIPHGYDPNVYKVKKFDEKPYFKFLFVGGYTGHNDRKGADLLVKAFVDEFKDDLKKKNPPLLYLKINTSYGDASQEFEGKPGVIVDRNLYSENELSNLYNTADCYVCPSQGEGFDMTTLEAMACGLPVIHNEWGGQIDYINPNYDENRTILLDSNYTYSRFSPWDIGFWRKPSYEDLRKALRIMYKTKPEKKKYSKISEFIWDNAGKKAIEAVECLEQ